MFFYDIAFVNILAPVNDVSTKGPRTMTTSSRRLRILVVQGHRNTSGGDSREIARTPAVANAITDALKAAGHEAACLQNSDGRADDWFAGSLDAVGREILARHRQVPIDLMLDVHFEGDPAGTPGVFTIVPDGDGLKTITPYPDSDALAANPLDHALGRAISQAVAGRTGLSLRKRGVVEPGVMSERATYVGADLGWRLAMFGYTAPGRDRMIRLILECGNIEADAAIIDRPDFPKHVAQGVVEGISRVLSPEMSPISIPTPEGEGASTFPPFGTVVTLKEPRLTTVTVDSLNARQWAELGQPIRGVWKEGRRFWTGGWVIGDAVEGNPVWWITGKNLKSDLQWRVWSGGTDLAGAAVMALARR